MIFLIILVFAAVAILQIPSPMPIIKYVVLDVLHIKY
jgi:hypothetical protein